MKTRTDTLMDLEKETLVAMLEYIATFISEYFVQQTTAEVIEEARIAVIANKELEKEQWTIHRS